MLQLPNCLNGATLYLPNIQIHWKIIALAVRIYNFKFPRVYDLYIVEWRNWMDADKQCQTTVRNEQEHGFSTLLDIVKSAGFCMTL
jgi:hypothetical protein